MSIMGYGWKGVKLSDLDIIKAQPFGENPHMRKVRVKGDDGNYKRLKDNPYYYEKKEVPVHEYTMNIDGEEKTYLITDDALDAIERGVERARESRRIAKAQRDAYAA